MIVIRRRISDPFSGVSGMPATVAEPELGAMSVPSVSTVVVFPAPVEVVFGLWTNLDRMTEWVGGVTKVTDVSGPIDLAGTTYTVWFGPMRSPTEVITAERPRRFETRFGNRLLRDRNVATFDADG